VIHTLLVLVHAAAGVVAAASGATAMLASKGGRAHRRGGRVYLAALGIVCSSGGALAIARWPHFPHLLALAVIAAALGAAGYAARSRTRPAAHLVAMGTSYVAMLTAFYVDNGPKLPIWRLLPQAAFWVLPSLVALPLLVRALRRHAATGRT
jgi:uncharacterized membrane protein